MNPKSKLTLNLVLKIKRIKSIPISQVVMIFLGRRIADWFSGIGTHRQLFGNDFPVGAH
jgi:hypothetical protein